MIQFFAPDITTNPVLPESDSQHCVRVLRKTIGDTIEVIDGQGYRYTCSILDPHPRRTLVEITDRVFIPKPWSCRITVAVAPTKHLDRMEWMCEKLTEIGVDRIVPLLCRHSERKEIKTERLKKIVVSAMKQSLKSFMPEVDEMTSIKHFLAENDNSQKFIAYCDSTLPRQLLAASLRPLADVTILIGPEGDFTPEEVEAAMSVGYIPVTLGDCRLRTETAAIAACQTVHVINQLAKD